MSDWRDLAREVRRRAALRIAQRTAPAPAQTSGLDPAYQDLLLRMEASKPATIGEQAQDVVSGVARGLAQVPLDALYAAGHVTGSDTLKQASVSGSQAVQRAVPPSNPYRETVGGAVGGFVGGVAPIVASGPLSKILSIPRWAATAGAFGVSGYGAGARAATEAGAPLSQQITAGLGHGAIGAGMAIPAEHLLGAASRPYLQSLPGVVGSNVAYAGAGSVAGNVVNRATFAPETPLTEGTGTALAGAALGTPVVHGLTHVAKPSKPPPTEKPHPLGEARALPTEPVLIPERVGAYHPKDAPEPLRRGWEAVREEMGFSGRMETDRVEFHEPETPDEAQVSLMPKAGSGARVVFVRRSVSDREGNTRRLPKAGVYIQDPITKQKYIILDSANRDHISNRMGVFWHEVLHWMDQTDKEATDTLYAELEGKTGFKEQATKVMQDRLRDGYTPELYRQEAVNYQAEALAGYMNGVINNPEAFAALAKKKPGIVTAIKDAVLRAFQSMGLLKDVRSFHERELLRKAQELTQLSPHEKDLSPQDAIKQVTLIRDAIHSFLSIEPPAQAKPEPTAKPVQPTAAPAAQPVQAAPVPVPAKPVEPAKVSVVAPAATEKPKVTAYKPEPGMRLVDSSGAEYEYLEYDGETHWVRSLETGEPEAVSPKDLRRLYTPAPERAEEPAPAASEPEPAPAQEPVPAPESVQAPEPVAAQPEPEPPAPSPKPRKPAQAVREYSAGQEYQQKGGTADVRVVVTAVEPRHIVFDRLVNGEVVATGQRLAKSVMTRLWEPATGRPIPQPEKPVAARPEPQKPTAEESDREEVERMTQTVAPEAVKGGADEEAVRMIGEAKAPGRVAEDATEELISETLELPGGGTIKVRPEILKHYNEQLAAEREAGGEGSYSAEHLAAASARAALAEHIMRSAFEHEEALKHPNYRTDAKTVAMFLYAEQMERMGVEQMSGVADSAFNEAEMERPSAALEQVSTEALESLAKAGVLKGESRAGTHHYMKVDVARSKGAGRVRPKREAKRSAIDEAMEEVLSAVNAAVDSKVLSQEEGNEIMSRAFGVDTAEEMRAVLAMARKTARFSDASLGNEEYELYYKIERDMRALRQDKKYPVSRLRALAKELTKDEFEWSGMKDYLDYLDRYGAKEIAPGLAADTLRFTVDTHGVAYSHLPFMSDRVTEYAGYGYFGKDTDPSSARIVTFSAPAPPQSRSHAPHLRTHFDEAKALFWYLAANKHVAGETWLHISEVQSDEHQGNKNSKYPLAETWHRTALRHALLTAARDGYVGITISGGREVSARSHQDTLNPDKGNYHFYGTILPRTLEKIVAGRAAVISVGDETGLSHKLESAINDLKHSVSVIDHWRDKGLKPAEAFAAGFSDLIGKISDIDEALRSRPGLQGSDATVYLAHYYGVIVRDLSRVVSELKATGDYIARPETWDLAYRAVHDALDVLRETQLHIAPLRTALRITPQLDASLKRGLPFYSRLYQGDKYAIGSPDRGKLRNTLDRAYWSFHQTFVDEFDPAIRAVQDVQRQGGTAGPSGGPEVALTNHPKRVAYREKELNERFWVPMRELFRSSGINPLESTDDLPSGQEFLMALHAPERNDLIVRRANGKPGPGNKLWHPESNPGSGMKTSEAQSIVARALASPKAASYRELQRLNRALNEHVMEMRVKYNLLSEQDAAKWVENFGEDYIPLKTSFDPEESHGLGRGFDIRGPESKKAKGRTTLADDLLAHAFAQVSETIVRGEKNLVDRSFAKFVASNPDKKLWRIVNKVREDQRHRAVGYKTGGQQRYILFSDPKIADSLHRIGVSRGDVITKYLGPVTRAYARMNTSWNPEFLVPNVLRDLSAGGLNMTSDGRADIAKRLPVDAWKAARAMWRVLGDGKAKGEWEDVVREFREHGGEMGWVEAPSVEAYQKKLESDIAEFRSHKYSPKRLYKVLQGAASVMERANGALENGTRIAVYKAARDSGMSAPEAAALASRATVDFTRKGTASPLMNAMFVFFNANIQGTARTLHGIHKNRRKQALMAAMMGTGFMVSTLNRYVLSDRDEDGVLFWDKKSDWEKSRELILMIPGGQGRSINIPLPWGWSVAQLLGTQADSAVNTGRSRADLAHEALKGALESFNPMPSPTLTQFLSPTITDPVVQILDNVDYAGRPVAPPENPFQRPPRPEFLRHFRNVSPEALAMAEWMNSVSGGNLLEPGMVDVSPEHLELLAAQAAGGVGAFSSRAYAALANAIRGGDMSISSLPIVRRFQRTLDPEKLVRSEFYRHLQSVALEKGRASVLGDRSALKTPVGKLSGTAAVAERRLRLLTKQLDRATTDAKRQKIEEQIQDVMHKFNTTFSTKAGYWAE